MLATVTHEVRTPLNAVIGMTELLRQMPLPPDAASLVETIHMSGEHLLALVDDMLDSARLETGRVVLEEVDFVLRDVVEEAIEIAAATAGAKRLSVAGVVDAELPDVVRGDPRRLAQVLANLLGNAVKFTPRGFVRLRAMGLVATTAQVSVRFEVEDSGIGIEPAFQDRLFEPFEQADETTGRRFGGTGLGLAIASRLVDAMGGRIAVDSAPGQGSRFHFDVTLPRGTAHKGLAWPGCAGLRVLLASADVVLIESMTAQARRLQAELIVADAPDDVAARLGGGAVAMLLDPRLTAATACRRAAASVGLPVVDLVPARAAGTVPGVHLRLPSRLASLAHVIATLRPATPRSPVQVSTLPRGHWRVLVVEDNEANQQLALRVLERAGVKADVAATGEEACAMVTDTAYDLVLLDCRLPGIDGMETARRLRTRFTSERMPIVGLSASVRPGVRRDCLDAGMDDFLTKPTRPSVLIEAVRRWLPDVAAADEMPRRVEGFRIADGPLLDRATVTELERLDLLDVMAQAVVIEAPARLGELRTASTRGDSAALATAAHRLTTLLGNVGWTSAASLAAHLETACDEPGRLDVHHLAEALDQLVLAGLPTLERLGRRGEKVPTCVP